MSVFLLASSLPGCQPVFQAAPKVESPPALGKRAPPSGTDGGAFTERGSAYTEPFKFDNKIAIKRHTLTIHIAEDSLESRRARQKIVAPLSMNSFENAHVLVKDPVSVAFYRRKHFPGSSASTGIGPVPLLPEEEAWCRPLKMKKHIYGKANRVAPGGRTEGIDSETAKNDAQRRRRRAGLLLDVRVAALRRCPLRAGGPLGDGPHPSSMLHLFIVVANCF